MRGGFPRAIEQLWLPPRALSFPAAQPPLERETPLSILDGANYSLISPPRPTQRSHRNHRFCDQKLTRVGRGLRNFSHYRIRYFCTVAIDWTLSRP